MTVIMKNICNIHSMQKMTDVSGRNLSKMKMEMSARTTAKQKRSKGFPKDCKRRSSAIIGGRYHCDNCPLFVMKKTIADKKRYPIPISHPICPNIN